MAGFRVCGVVMGMGSSSEISFAKNAVFRCFGVAVKPSELERFWPQLEARHAEYMEAFGPRWDIRATALDLFVELGLIREPVVAEESSLRRVEALAFRDSLTGLFNYGYFEQQLQTELARAQRHGTPLCLILIDLDGFKSVNDTLGHRMGNVVLNDVANVLRRGLREGDVVARLGGDEFAVMLHQSDERAGLLIAERKRREIEEWFVEHRYARQRARVTASFGVSMLEAPQNSRQSLYDDADRALYQAKENGRNRVLMSFCGWESVLRESVLS